MHTAVYVSLRSPSYFFIFVVSADSVFGTDYRLLSFTGILRVNVFYVLKKIKITKFFSTEFCFPMVFAYVQLLNRI